MPRPRLIAGVGAAALLAAPLIGLLACGSSTPVARDDAGPAAAATCGFHPVCGCASPSRLASCTRDQSYNSVTVRCGPV
jgi:hypothetical protein